MTTRAAVSQRFNINEDGTISPYISPKMVLAWNSKENKIIFQLKKFSTNLHEILIFDKLPAMKAKRIEIPLTLKSQPGKSIKRSNKIISSCFRGN